MLKHATLTRPSSRLGPSPMQRININKTTTSCLGLDNETDNCDSTNTTYNYSRPEAHVEHQQTPSFNNKDLILQHSLTNSGPHPIARRQLDFSTKQSGNTDVTNQTNDWLNKTGDHSHNNEMNRPICTPESYSIGLDNIFNNSTCTTPSPLTSPSKPQQNKSQMSLASHLISPNRNRISPTKMLGFRSLSRLSNNNNTARAEKLVEENLETGTILDTQSFKANNNHHSMIKVFAQTLSQDVEYKTIQVTSQTRSSQIVRSLLKKFRLKHRDPNLYYLTLERWIRKDGIKSRNVMLLSDDACPLQLQQCCSNPPHNDIKFTLQMRTGALVKIYCSDVVQDARYKCLSLSAQTTVEETIDLMVHCLNLVEKSNHPDLIQSRITNSPGSIMSTNSSSSGIESDPNPPTSSHLSAFMSSANEDRLLNNNSRASSVTSISTSSNTSTLSSSLIDQYCLIIECKDTNYRRVLDSDEYLVDVYQGLLAEAKGQPCDMVDTVPMSPTSPTTKEKSSRSKNHVLDATPTRTNKSHNHNFEFVKSNPDQWFLIKLVRRDDFNIRQQYPMSAIKLANPRHSPPPPIPSMPVSMMSQFNSSTMNMRNVVSTAEIEVINGHFSSNSFSGQCNGTSNRALNNNELIDYKSKKVDEIDGAPSLPPKFVLLPPIKPRRNISTRSSSFGPPLINCTTANGHSVDNRRRYDPARLAEDLSQLNIES